MSLTIIAIAGVLLGFLCLLVGFFMDAQEPLGRANGNVIKMGLRERRLKTVKRRAVGLKRKVA